mmetsp:Transcript_50142/g.55953  ORF Transcript_50142/g.55953 Transcript_50142/m.55953 type:complete len:739 (+) Transcript_50142:89-2305(+)
MGGKCEVMQTIKSLREEKARLLKEIERVESKIKKHDEHDDRKIIKPVKKTDFPIIKSGYLFKWQDRQIGWGGTKWDLRFVKLDKGRLAYFKNHDDTAPRYLLTLKNCAIRDDGSKPNKRFQPKENEKEIIDTTPGAFFHVFSLYQRPKGKIHASADLDDDDVIVPLLRFSTISLAEKIQWMDLLVEACVYCDSDYFDVNEISSFDPRNISLQMSEFDTNTTHTEGTLSPLYFVPPPVKIGRIPSHSGLLPKTSSYLKLNSNEYSAKSNSRKKNDYPPSKPMHRKAETSYLGHDSPTPNYRGLLNLGIIILVVSNFRILLGIMRQYGFVLTHGFFSSSEEEYSFKWEDIVDVHFVSGMAMLNIFVILAYFIELGTSQKVLNECSGISLHVINTNLSLLLPMIIVWKYIYHPVNGGILLMSATVLWMKLVSYAHANADLRNFPHRNVENIVQNADEDSTFLCYPCNITITNIYYFWFAPTLTYQMVFPRVGRRSMGQILSLILRLFLCFVLLAFLVAQVFRPILNNMLEELNELEEEDRHMLSVHILAEYLLKLGIASSYIWLLVFYGFFHVLLNLLAQLLRFGDRVFYKDWWNSSNLSSYWRLWNLPVHYWLVRHLYHPCIRRGASKSTSMFIVFFLSAVVHEMLISIPFHMIRFYSFFGMMGQIPLVAITKYIDKVRPGSSIGNFIFWLSFCFLGQPIAIMFYTIDYWKLNSIPGEASYGAEECKSTDTCFQDLGNEL